MTSRLHIEFTRFSAFYTPLIATMAGGFLADEGVEHSHSIAPAGKTSVDAVLAGRAQVGQSALVSSLLMLEAGKTPPVRHFGQINGRDGFFLVARKLMPNFTWTDLSRAKLLIDCDRQPLAMFKFGCKQVGLDFEALNIEDLGGPDKMIEAFCDGTGDFVHLQGPAAQQLEREGHGFVATSMGEAVGPCGFSSILATADWLATDEARCFGRAYRRARKWINETEAAEIAAVQQSFFPSVDLELLARTIEDYKRVGCWAGDGELTKQGFDQTVAIFRFTGNISRDYAFEQVCSPMPR